MRTRCDIISALSRHKADVNVTGNDGHTPLHWAALKGHVKAVSLLLKIGAKKDAADNWDFTPLIRASQNGHLFVVLLLLQEGADPTMVDNERHNALHWAVYHRWVWTSLVLNPSGARLFLHCKRGLSLCTRNLWRVSKERCHFWVDRARTRVDDAGICHFLNSRICGPGTILWHLGYSRIHEWSQG